MNRKLVSKVIPLREAISKYVKDGSMVGFAGSSGRMSTASALEIIAQRKKNLSFASAGTAAACLDLLVGAKIAKRAEISFTMVTCENIKRSLEGPKRKHSLEIEDYSNLAMTLRFFAGATRIPFIPIRSVSGSDIEKIRTFMGKEKMARIKSPFKDRTSVTVLPPCAPDIGIMHAQCADEMGNVLALGAEGSDGWLLKASKKILITVEKIVSRDYVKQHRKYTFLPGFMVDAVCEVKYGAHPYGLLDCYDADVSFQKSFRSQSKTDEGFREWAKEWIFGARDRDEYLKKIGSEVLEKITNEKLRSNTLFN